MFYPHITNIIGNGVALDVPKFLEELEHLEAGGVPAPHIIISERTQVLMPYHVLQDQYEEERLGGHAFGSTKSGIAPFYSDKYAKYGIQVCELFDEKRLMERLEQVCKSRTCSLNISTISRFWTPKRSSSSLWVIVSRSPLMSAMP